MLLVSSADRRNSPVPGTHTPGIRFGTDGWRGVIADNFTFGNVRLVSQAIADYLKAIGEDQRGLVVGYDRRFLSEQFAQEVASVLAANKITVYLAKTWAPTPAISYAVVQRGTAGGIVVTASHNLPQYNGLKFKGAYGGPASSDMTGGIEEQLQHNLALGKIPLWVDFSQALQSGIVSLFDPKQPYLQQIRSILDLNLLRTGSQFKIVVDAMHGSGAGYTSEVLRGLGYEVLEIRADRDPLFGGVQPEPIGENLKELSHAVVKSNAAIGLAMDGDADRIGAVDSTGRFVNSHQIFALLLRYLSKVRGWHGSVVKTVSTTSMIDLLCEQLQLRLYETPVGFKHICEFMCKDDIMIGGEESGGIGVKGHIPERDGVLSGLLLVEQMVALGKGMEELLEDIGRELGTLYYKRRDCVISSQEHSILMDALNSLDISRLNGIPVLHIDRLDGVKLLLADGSWLMLRLSDTEPVLRIYSESSSIEGVDHLLDHGEALCLKSLQI